MVATFHQEEAVRDKARGDHDGIGAKGQRVHPVSGGRRRYVAEHLMGSQRIAYEKESSKGNKERKRKERKKEDGKKTKKEKEKEEEGRGGK
jgi:hypothetical protein